MASDKTDAQPIVADNDTTKFTQQSRTANAVNPAKNTCLVVLGLAAAAALAGASAADIASYTGTGYSGPGSCAALAIAAGDDPKVRTMIDDNNSFTTAGNARTNSNIANFSTFYNTVGGESTTSFTVSHNALATATIAHQGNNPWTVSAMQVGSSNKGSVPQLAAVVTDATGTHVVSGTYQSADGTVFTYANNSLTVTEPLNAGGAVTSVISFQKDTDNGNRSYLDLAESASGAVIANGAAIDFATNSTAPKLILPCSGPPQDTTPGNIPGLAMGPPADPPVNNPPANNPPAPDPGSGIHSANLSM